MMEQTYIIAIPVEEYAYLPDNWKFLKVKKVMLKDRNGYEYEQALVFVSYPAKYGDKKTKYWFGLSNPIVDSKGETYPTCIEANAEILDLIWLYSGSEDLYAVYYANADEEDE